MLLEKNVKAQIILENGVKFYGEAFGYIKETIGEVVFNTGMTGYQEMLTDPSYAGQIITCTYPLMGNYGVNLDDMESDSPRLRGLVVRESCKQPNNWRCEMELSAFLKQNKIVGLEGIDTRALTKILRDTGTMKGIITTRVDELTKRQIEQKFASFTNKNVVKEVTTKEIYKIEGTGTKIAVIDLGVKWGILRELAKRNFRMTVFPAFSTYDDIMKENPDGIFVSNGPGNPDDLQDVIEVVKKLIKTKPVAGICMGHQVIARALGERTEKMKFGHHGENHPVRDEQTKRVYITSQNHEYVVKNVSKDVIPWFTNINDGTVEGVRHKSLPVMSVQFHPEAAPGPRDSAFLFDIFAKLLEGGITHA